MRKISIDPNTRLEGHGKVEIILDDDGNVKDAYFQVVEFRGFEKFCEGRHVEELPRITPKICGVCPGAHHMASTKACDAVFEVEPTETAKKLREIFYNAHVIHSHMLHFYALSLPDLLLMSADAKERNIFGLLNVLGKEVVAEAIECRGYAQKIQEMLAGHPIYPVFGLPGGVSKPLEEEDRKKIEEMAKKLVEFGKKGLEIFENHVLKNEEILELIKERDVYYQETNYLGLVDENGCVNFYDGILKAVDPEGNIICTFEAKDYLDYIAEHVEPWSYVKFPYLKQIGWKGLVEGKGSGIYRVNALARLNVADGMATPLANEAYKAMFEFFGKKPVHNILAYNWARLIEILYGAERILELVQDEEVTSKDVRNIPKKKPSEGVGVVEAPRGVLIHHYVTDSHGVVEKVNLIVATVQNNPAINLSIKKAAQNLIKNGKVDGKILNMIEMAVRAYDPCLACASHALPGSMPLVVDIYWNGELYKRFIRNG